MDEQSNPNSDNTELVLPIICPNCSHELNLGMVFALLPPESPVKEDNKENESEKED